MQIFFVWVIWTWVTKLLSCDQMLFLWAVPPQSVPLDMKNGLLHESMILPFFGFLLSYPILLWLCRYLHCAFSQNLASVVAKEKKILVMIAQSVTWTQKHLHLQLRHGGFVWVFPKMMGDAIQKKRKRNCRSAGVGTEEVETGNKAIREDYFLLAADSLMFSNLCIFLTVIWEYKMLLHSCI